MGELTSGEIVNAMFHDMRNRYNAWVNDPANKGKLPTEIYTVKGGKNYVLLHVFDNMVERYDAFVRENGREPGEISIQPTINKPAWFKQLETNLSGTINSMPDLYNLVVAEHHRVGSIYQHISCRQGATLDQMVAGVKHQYNNCARWSYLAMQVAIVLGEDKNTRYIHVDCDYSNGKPDLSAGHYLLIWRGIKYDLAHAASSGGAMNTTMCINGYNGVLDYNVPCN